MGRDLTTMRTRVGRDIRLQTMVLCPQSLRCAVVEARRFAAWSVASKFSSLTHCQSNQT